MADGDNSATQAMDPNTLAALLQQTMTPNPEVQQQNAPITGELQAPPPVQQPHLKQSFTSSTTVLHFTTAKTPASPHHLAKPSTISTGRLQPLLTVHLRPIKLVVFERSYSLSR